MKTYHVLNLGAGVQSTAVYLLSCDRDNNLEVPFFDAAIFADTQEEPTVVYDHLEHLKSLNGPPIWYVTKGSLGNHLMRGQNSTGQRFASIPAFTKAPGDAKEGRLRRQCTKEYKIEPIWKEIRQRIVGLKPRQRWPKDVHVVQYFGISLEEARRSLRILERMKKSRGQTSARFPLIDAGWTRATCQAYNAPILRYETPRSACVFCPYKTDEEWRVLYQKDRSGWERANKIDQALRTPGLIVNRGMNKPLYLHRECEPLFLLPFAKPKLQPPGFVEECEGMCGV